MVDERKEDEETQDDVDSSTPNLYSLLNLPYNATTEEIRRSYRTLSTSFHPDKVRRRRQQISDESELEEIQETFLLFKTAHDVLIDPVLRLAYDGYGETGVDLIRRVQQQHKDQKTRQEEAAAKAAKGENGKEDDHAESEEADSEDEDSDDESETDLNLYERLEALIVHQGNTSKAKKELQTFMEQHDYMQNLTEDNFVHLNLSMTFPPVVPLKPVLYRGRDYLRAVQKNLMAAKPADPSEQEYYQQRVLQEKRLVDYQISQLRSSQQADVGFTLSSVQPPRNHSNGHNNKGTPLLQPSKWSMAVGCSTDVVYPSVKELADMVSKADPKRQAYQDEAETNPITMFVNTSYQAAPTTQIFGTANLNNDNESHQYSLGSTHTFVNQTACRYSLTYLSKTPLPDDAPVLMSLKTYRHLQGIGTASVGLSAGSNGQVLQWDAKWEGSSSSSKAVGLSHKYSVKASIGMLQGNGMEFGYKCKFPKANEQPPNKDESNNFWYVLEEYIHLPKRAEATAIWGTFSKINAKVTHEITSLATHPSLSFGLEHDISLGRWNWVWEIEYNQSTFRIPIPVLQLGTITNSQAFYAQKFYYGIYCLLLQSIVSDLLEEEDNRETKNAFSKKGDEMEELSSEKGPDFPAIKSKSEADKQLALMKPVAEAKFYREQQKQDSLQILSATYWHKLCHPPEGSPNGLPEYELVSMDATTQLRFWVHNGKLVCPRGIPKSSWMGFYTLETESKFQKQRKRRRKPKDRIFSIWTEAYNFMKPKLDQWWSKARHLSFAVESPIEESIEDVQQTNGPQLTVRYAYQSNVYEITVAETEGLVLPCSNDDNDRVQHLGDANYVQ